MEEKKNITYVSRIQCVQAAIADQLEKISLEKPDLKVGLVFFNNEVTVVGDGLGSPLIITGDKLENKEAIIESVKDYRINAPIKESKEALIAKLYEINESGATALGPGIVASIAIGEKFGIASIVLATDGLANVGIGKMEGVTDIEALENFYTVSGNEALAKNIAISIISIKGDEVNINIIGKLSDITQGELNIVDPINITQEFSGILESQVIAKDVKVKLFLHKSLQFKNIEGEKINDFCTEKQIGIAYSNSEFTFDFDFKKEEIDLMLQTQGESEVNIPFQIQIFYTKPNGMKCIRVITQTKEMSTNKEEVEDEIDTGVIVQHYNFTTATKAQGGRVNEALDDRDKVQRLISRNQRTNEDGENLEVFEGYTYNMQNVERKTRDKSENIYYNMRSKKKKSNMKTKSIQQEYNNDDE